MKVYAQGDIILVTVTDVEPKPQQIVDAANGTVVLAHGEQTGHQHAFYGGAVLFRDERLARDVPPELYVGHVKIRSGGAVLEHGPAAGVIGDHDPIKIPPGTYIVCRQREFVGRESLEARILCD